MGTGTSKYEANERGKNYVTKKDSIKDPNVRVTTSRLRNKLAEITRKIKKAKDILADNIQSDVSEIIPLLLECPREGQPGLVSCAVQQGLLQAAFRHFRELYEKDVFEPAKDDVLDVMHAFLFVLMKCSEHSLEACEMLMKEDAVSFFLNVVQDPKLLTSEASNDSSNKKSHLSRGSVSLILFMVMSSNPEVGNAFRENNAVQILRKTMESTKDAVLKFGAISALAYLINEDENDIIATDETHIKHIADFLQDATNSPGHCTQGGINVMTMAKTLNKLAMNDNNKRLIGVHGVLQIYAKLLGDDVPESDQIELINGIWTLAFDQGNKITISKMHELYSILKSLNTHENKELRNVVNGALWTLEGGEQKKQAWTQEKSVASTSSDNVSHVMISYNWGVKPLALQIKNKLKERGYKVSMDVDNMTGSTLEAMAEAVEQAAAVLICMTRNYKESPSCRTEAEYAYQLRKSFIPLCLEAGYKADGWLGKMVGTKLSFDFTKNFNGAMTGLVKELGNQGKIGAPPIEVKPIAGTVLRPLTTSSIGLTSASAKSLHSSWSVLEVSKWLRKNDLGLHIAKFAKMDGALLDEMKYMMENAPEFFYTYMASSKMTFSLVDILTFTKALKSLK